MGAAPAPAPFRGSAPFLKIAPPPWLPLRHFAFAALSLPVFAAGVLLAAERLVGWGFDARFALGLVHTLTLGWLAQTILGAWCQMIPVHGEAAFARPGLAAAAWWVFCAGAAAFVTTLWSGSDLYWIPGTALLGGVLLYLAAFAPAHARAARRDSTWLHFAAAMGWLAVLAVLGLLMAYDRQRGVLFPDPEGGLVAHAHAALVGFAATTIYGAGHRLFPWVAMHQADSRWEGRASFALTQTGLAGLVLDALFFGRALMTLWAALLALGFLAYALQMRPLLRAKPAFDPALGFLLLAFCGGAAWAGLGLGLAADAFPEVVAARAAYAWTALVGCATPVILSQVHKIAPFVVWLHVYSPRQWTPPVQVPKIEDLTSRRLAWAELAGLAAAAPLGAAGLFLESAALVRLAGACLSLTAVCYLANLAGTLRHALRPEGRWDAPGAV